MKDDEKALSITRIFDAPRELVWKAWTDPEMSKKWWGPKGFTCPVSKIDFRVGGKYLYCMRGPDGKDYWGTGVYKEIVPMEKFVASDSFADENGNIVPSTHYGMEGLPMELEVTVTFEESRWQQDQDDPSDMWVFRKERKKNWPARVGASPSTSSPKA